MVVFNPATRVDADNIRSLTHPVCAAARTAHGEAIAQARSVLGLDEVSQPASGHA
jgi:DNA-binding cell septation regulator SpoVG